MTTNPREIITDVLDKQGSDWWATQTADAVLAALKAAELTIISRTELGMMTAQIETARRFLADDGSPHNERVALARGALRAAEGTP